MTLTSAGSLAAPVQLLHALPWGVFLLGGKGSVIFRNRQARSMLSDADGLALKEGALHVLRKSDESRLQRLIAGACEGVQGPHVMALERPSGRRAYGMLVIPLDAGRRSPGPSVALLVSDPERQAGANENVLRHIFGLTRSEASLVVLLAGGRTLQQVAAGQKIATRTARVHLRNVFRKTGVRRQSELIRIVCLSVAVLVASGEAGAAGDLEPGRSTLSYRALDRGEDIPTSFEVVGKLNNGGDGTAVCA